MRVLVACEFSGVVREAFLARGHDAYSCDLIAALHLPDRRRMHRVGDVRPMLNEKWDLVIAHPPCTFLTKAGAPARQADPSRREKMVRGLSLFMDCMNANADRVAVENPVPFKEVIDLIGRGYDQVIHPYQFGDPRSKATCLWLKNLPHLVPTNVVEPSDTVGRTLPPGPFRGRLRSITSEHIAAAMADQWGSL